MGEFTWNEEFRNKTVAEDYRSELERVVNSSNMDYVLVALYKDFKKGVLNQLLVREQNSEIVFCMRVFKEGRNGMLSYTDGEYVGSTPLLVEELEDILSGN